MIPAPYRLQLVGGGSSWPLALLTIKEGCVRPIEESSSVKTADGKAETPWFTRQASAVRSAQASALCADLGVLHEQKRNKHIQTAGSSKLLFIPRCFVFDGFLCASSFLLSSSSFSLFEHFHLGWTSELLRPQSQSLELVHDKKGERGKKARWGRSNVD